MDLTKANKQKILSLQHNFHDQSKEAVDFTE